MRPSPSNIATKTLLFILALAWSQAWAEPVGQVTNLSGPLFAQNTQGVRRILSVGSQVEPGETLITEDKTYAQVRFIDKGVVTLKPGTHFKIESFAFEEQAPQKDNAVFGLFKGAMRTVTGLVGKRGNQDAYKMNTATATIGIRGTHFLVQVVPEQTTAVSRVPYALPVLASLDPRWIEAANGTLEDAPTGLFSLDLPLELAQAGPPPAGLAPGTYTHVFEGQIQVSTAPPPNFLGTLPSVMPSLILNPGQSSHAPPVPPTAPTLPPPVIVPPPPAIINNFAPPPSFTTTQNQALGAPPGAPPPPPPPPSSDGCVVR